MAFDKQTENAFLTLTLMMALFTFPVIATTNNDCNGKAFYCVNSTHFQICVDFGGVSKTVDDFLIACPPSTVCLENNFLECEYPVLTTSATVSVQSDVTNEFTEKTSPWDLFEVITFLPVNDHEKSVEFVDKWTKTSIETVSQPEVTETTDIVNYTPVNEVILGTKNILHNTTLSESANNSPKSIDLITNSEFSKTAAIDVTKDNLSAISTGATTVDHSRAENELLNESLNTIVTTPSSKAHTENLTLTKIIAPTIIDYLSTKRSDLIKTVTTTPRNNVGTEYFISTPSLVSTVNVGDLSSNSSLAEVINKVTESDTSIDLLKSDTTASSPNLEKVESNTESVINHITSQNVVKESNISEVTMAYDSYILSIQQDITVNPIFETVTEANEFLTNDEMKKPRDRLNDSSDFFDNKLEDKTTQADTDQTELDGTTDINVTLNFTAEAEGFSLKNSLSPQLVDVNFLKAESITTSSDVFNSATSTNHVTIQKSTEASLNLPTPKTNHFTKSYNMVNTDTNNNITPITLSPLATSKSHLVSESIFKSSTDEIRASADFYEEIGKDNQRNNMTESNINVPTTVATTLSNFYTNIGQNSSRVGVNDLLVQNQQITADTDINSQTATTTTVDIFYADIKENTAQVGIGDLLTQSQNNMTETDINFLTTTPTNVDHLNIINNTFQDQINTLLPQRQQNMTETNMDFQITSIPNVNNFYINMNHTSEVDLFTRNQRNVTETDVNFLTTTITNMDELYTNISKKTSQAGQKNMTDVNFLITTPTNLDYLNITNKTSQVLINTLFTQNQQSVTDTDVTEADIKLLTATTTPTVDYFYTDIINNTSQIGVSDIPMQSQQSIIETDINLLTTTTTPTVDDLYTDILNSTSQIEVTDIRVQSQQSMTQADINLLTTTTTPTVDDFYTDIIKNISQIGVTDIRMKSQQNMTEADINLLTITTITTPTGDDFYTDIINNTSQIGVTDIRMQSQQTEADMNLLTTTPIAANVDPDITNNPSQIGVTDIRMQSQHRMPEIDINLLTTTITPTVGNFYTDITNNTSQIGVTDIRMQSQQTEADMKLLTTTPIAANFDPDITNNPSQIGVTDIHMQSQQSMTETDINLLTTSSPTVDDFYIKFPKSISRVDNLFMHSQQNVTEPDKEFLTISTATVENFYIDIVKNISHVEANDLFIHKNIASDLPNAKFSAKTDRNNGLLDSTTDVNAVLKDIKGLSDPFQTENTVNKSSNMEFTTSMSPSDITLTTTTSTSTTASYVGNTQKSTNAIEIFTDLKKINNDTTQSLYETSTNKFLIEEITLPLSPHVDFISTNKTNTYSDNYNITTAINISLSTTADEFTMKATNAFSTKNLSESDLFKANMAFPSLSTNNIQHHPSTAIADGVHSDITIKDDFEGIKGFLLQQNDSKSTPLIFFNTSNHDIDTIETSTNVPETIVKPDIYGKTVPSDMELVKTQRILDHLFSTTTTEEIAILDNSITEITRNESDTFNEKIVSKYQLNRVKSINGDTQIANRDQDVNNAYTNTMVTWKPPRDTSNNTFQDLLTSKVTLEEITGTEITPTEFQNQPNNENGFNNKNTLTSHAYTIDGTDLNTNFMDLNISNSRATQRNVTDPLIYKMEKYRGFSGISNNINSFLSTESLNNIKIYKKELPEDITESSIPVSNNLEKPQIMFSSVENITNKNEDFNTNKSSTSTKGSDEFSATSKNLITKPSINIIHTISDSEDKNLNNMKSILQTSVTELPFTTPLRVFVTTAKPRPVISDLLLEKQKSKDPVMKNSTFEKNSGVTKVSNRLLEIVKINTIKNDMNSTMKEIAASIPQKNSKVTKNVDLVARPTLITKNLRPQILFRSNSKNASNTFNTSRPRSILREQLSNLNVAGDDQKNSSDNGIHITVNIDNESQNLSNNNLNLRDPVIKMQDKTTEQTTKVAFDFTNKNILKDYEMQSKFSCNNRYRGKYSDKNDCQNFYICIGRYDPIYGKCPNNTVFSEISKQCTRNLSHCIRNNQFKCISPGRYLDIFSDQFYYICVPQAGRYLRFKLKCQKGYHLDKMKLQCILDSCNASRSSEDSSKNDSEKSTSESRSSKSKEGKSKFLSKQQTEHFECKKEGKFEYPYDCRKYYVCNRNEKSGFKRKIKECDSDEVFDSKKRKCVDDDSYECK